MLEADGLDDETMLAFARETGLSETTFVQSPADPADPADSGHRAGSGHPAGSVAADYRNRIWTISGEIPFAGHPSLGTAVAVAIERDLDEDTFTQETGVGLQPVDVKRLGDRNGPDVWEASVLQERAVFGEVIPTAKVAAVLGIEEKLIDSRYSAQLVSTGLPALLIPIRDIEGLAACRGDAAALEALGLGLALNVYPFVFDVPSRMAHARCFALDLGDFEDPATGSAAGPLVAYLQNILDVDRIRIRQGIEMGRPGLIEARMDSGRPRVSGQVHVVMKGQARLPS